MSTCAVRQDNDTVDVLRDLLHAVADEHDGRAARAVVVADVVRAAPPGPAGQGPRSARRARAPRAPWRSRPRWPRGASARRRARRATFRSRSSVKSRKARGLMHAAVHLRRRSGPCSSGRRRCRGRRSPQRAGTPDTGTPAPRGSARPRIFFGSAQMSSPSSSTGRRSGLSRPFRCWISVDLPLPVWPMMPKNSPR